MRTIWNGSISFGLVNIPVGLALATQRQDVSFRTLHRECGTPIKQKRWCPVHERDVEPDELVKGWEFAKGQYVLVEESDLEAYAELREFPIIPCDLCGSQEQLQRKQVKSMMREWEKKHPGRMDTIFGALTNVAPSHLLDRTLHDFTRVMATDEPQAQPINLVPRASRMKP